jgi:antitoxin component YwqK of YwqJK toxin-antitoxin module
LEQGEHTWYYDTGAKMLEGEFVSGVKEGEWIRYNRDGSIFVNIEYQSGQEIKVDGYKLKIKSSESDDEE